MIIFTAGLYSGQMLKHVDDRLCGGFQRMGHTRQSERQTLPGQPGFQIVITNQLKITSGTITGFGKRVEHPERDKIAGNQNGMVEQPVGDVIVGTIAAG